MRQRFVFIASDLLPMRKSLSKPSRLKESAVCARRASTYPFVHIIRYPFFIAAHRLPTRTLSL